MSTSASLKAAAAIHENARSILKRLTGVKNVLVRRLRIRPITSNNATRLVSGRRTRALQREPGCVNLCSFNNSVQPTSDRDQDVTRISRLATSTLRRERKHAHPKTAVVEPEEWAVA
jgi:hypothetical protein